MIWLQQAKRFLGALAMAEVSIVDEMCSEDLIVSDKSGAFQAINKDTLMSNLSCSNPVSCTIIESCYNNKTIFIKYAFDDDSCVMIVKFDSFGKIFMIENF